MKNASYIFENLISDIEVRKLLESCSSNHPLPYILADETERFDSNHYTTITQNNTKQAIMTINRNDLDFLEKRKCVLLSKDRTSSSAALGEIRCYGVLLDVFGKESVHPVSTKRNKKTPDFRVSCDCSDLFIEVNTVQANEEEYKKLVDFENTPPSFDKSGISMREYCFTPFGTKKQSGTTPSVIYKLCSIKQNAEQLQSDTPAIIWVDLQDEFSNILSSRLHIGGPIFSGPICGGAISGFYSNEIWYSLYAPEKLAIFEGETLLFGEGIKKPLTTMKIDGKFANEDISPKVSAVVFNGADALVLFENPYAVNPLPTAFIKAISSWKTFRIESSVLNYSNDALICEIDNELRKINVLSSMEFYSW